MKKISADDVIRWDACWLREQGGEERIRTLLPPPPPPTPPYSVSYDADAYTSEREWQCQRVAEYLRGEVSK
jgi:hypothetical protein